MQYNQEDEPVEKTLEATLRDVEFDQYDDSPTRRMPELLTQSGGAKEKPAWQPAVRQLATAAGQTQLCSRETR